MSDGSAFTGTLAANPSGTVAISGTNLVLARALTAADNGPHQWGVTVTQNGVTVSGSIAVQVNAVPSSATCTPSSASLPDNAAGGTVVAAIAVAMSDGSAFTGALAASPAGTVAISGNKLVLARALTSADNGSHQWGVTATQNGVTVSGSIAVQVNAIPTPTSVTFTPSSASLPDNAAAGTVVAAIAVAMSDGSAFTGTLAANPSGTVAISGTKLVLARALTAADNGSHQWGVTATQNGVTVAASIVVQVNAISPPPPSAPPPRRRRTLF
jgi:predicted regulator of Ras-like GTPase activity (Roadblock/LC7/MglB family)